MYPVFRGLEEKKLGEIESALEPFSFDAGETVFEAGGSINGLYLIDKGYVEIFPERDLNTNHVELQIRKGPGEYFGEIALLDRRQHTARVTTISPVSGHLLPCKVFDELVEDSPRFLLNLTRNVFTELRHQDAELIHELSRARIKAEHTIDRMKALNTISRVLNSTLDLDQLLKMILDEATYHTECDTGTIYLLDRETNELISRVLQGEYVKEIRIPMGVGIAGVAAETRQAINISDAYADERFNPEIDRMSGYRTRNLLTCPMLSEEGQVTGVLQLLNKNRGDFTFEDEDFIAAMSVHASIAIEKAKLAERMIHSESLAAVGRFAASVIHDFRTPMTVISSYSELLRMSNLEEKSKRYLNGIESQVERMAGMAQEVLEYSRDQIVLSIDICNVIEFIDETLNLLGEKQQADGVEIVVEHKKKDLSAEFDSTKLARVILNLANNAMDAMEDGGTLTVTSSATDKTWRMDIRDTGIGIEEEKLDSIFEPFVTYGKSHGTGLGLAIARKVVEGHKGRIEVTSEVGEGTNFRITLPLKPEADQK